MNLIEENRLRHKILDAPFDPISGEGAPGERFELDIPDMPGLPRMWLPIDMKLRPVVRLLMEKKSISAFPPNDRVTLIDCFIRERLRADFPFWAASCVNIKRKGGGEDVRFILNRPQRRFVEILEKARLASRPIRLILLKARQWGGSTCSQLYMAWLQLMHSRGLNSLIIAHQGAGSDEIKDMFDRMISDYPVELLHPQGDSFDKNEKKIVGVGKSGAIFRVPQRNCKIKIGTAERPDSCRGGDYNLVHLSEVGIWKATDGKCPEDIVRSACSGILLRPMTMIVMESTANGTGNFFHREYLAAARGESQFESMFVSWMEIDQYSLPFSSRTEMEEFAKDLYNHRDNEEKGPRRQSGKYLWNLWLQGATLEAIHWYVSERSKYSDHAGMASEYPSDDIEAFAHSGIRVFDPYAVEALRAGCRPPVAVGEIIKVESGEWKVESGKKKSLSLKFVEDITGNLAIWKFPGETSPATFHSPPSTFHSPPSTFHSPPSTFHSPPSTFHSPPSTLNDRYLVVVDIGGRSEKADWTVIAVFDRAPMMDGGAPEIVAQWRGHADIDIVAMKSAEIARFYDEALLVIESNTIETHDRDRLTEGDQLPYVMACLRDEYDNLYVRRRSEVDIAQGAPLKYGFHTNVSTKPMVIAALVQAVREGLYVERDERALEELNQYEQRLNGSYGAIAGCHDDILMTRAIGLHISSNEMPLPRIIRTRSSSRTRSPRTESDFF